jgi:uncharacterized protein (TIGR03083 family)
MMSVIATETITAIDRHEMRGLATTEGERIVDQLRSLTPDDWARPTDCPLWDVRAMTGHMLGMYEDFTAFRRLAKNMRAATKAAKKVGGQVVDSLSAMQVAEHAHLSNEEVIDHIAAAAPEAARWRERAPGLFRRMPMKTDVDGTTETWRMGYLLDVILTRDPWMHRVDIARATGRELDLTPDHDGRIIADVVAEWARRHGEPFTLELTGPAGGTYASGTGGAAITIDAVEFCRTLSGREQGTGLLARQVPF